jgi:predicted amidohydrolase
VLGPIGVAICYDSEFPLLVRAQAEAGAEVILIPSCTESLSGHHRVRPAAQARALESQIATIVSPTVGDALWSPAVDRNVGAGGVFVPADPALSI